MGRYLLGELHKWVNGNSLLMVTITGLLSRLYCPFTVQCLEPYNGLKKHYLYKVERVGVDERVHLVYFITGRAYPYHLFRIIGRA